VNQVITAEQAKKITGGRTPLVPVEYETAVNALQACIDLNEAKYWKDKAEMLSAWAKMYHHDRAGLLAKRLKLHAFRRMGQLAEQLRPTKYATKGHIGRQPGASKLLEEHGVNRNQATLMIRLGKVPDRKFESVVNSPAPPSPSYFYALHEGNSSDGWRSLRNGGFKSFLSFLRGHRPREVARSIRRDEVLRVRSCVLEAMEWLDTFDQTLPKGGGSEL
jgi:hypothetical protein